MGWFFGFKLHMMINDIGQIMAIKITKGNIDDRTPVTELTKKLKGCIYTDKGYIGAGLFKALYKRGLKLITGIRKNKKTITLVHNHFHLVFFLLYKLCKSFIIHKYNVVFR